MTTIDTHQVADHTESAGAPAALASIADWCTSIDHKKIGRLLIGGGLIELLVVALVGLWLGAERLSVSSAVVDFDALLQLFQMYRVGLVFGVAAPIGLGLAVAIAPLQVGARSIAFPRLAMMGFYVWLGGTLLTFASLIGNGGIGGGQADMIDLFLVGNALTILGLAGAAISVATTVMTTRAAGMTLGRVPIFSWSALVGTIGALLVLPVAFGLIVMLFVDHRYGGGQAFGPSENFEAWLGWVWSTPAVLVFCLPIFGLFAELVPVTFRVPGSVPGIRRLSIALIGVVALAALTQQRSFTLTFGHGQRFGQVFDQAIMYVLFVGLPLIGLFGSGLVGFLNVKDGLKNDRPAPSAPFVVTLMALVLLITAFVGNALLSIGNLDLVGTTFEEGVVLFAAYGVVLGVFGGLVFWAPKLSGKIVGRGAASSSALLIFLGAVVAAGSMWIAGFIGQAGGVPNSDAAVNAMLDLSFNTGFWNIASGIGNAMVAVGVIMFTTALVRAKSAKAGDDLDNPYGGLTLEWTAMSPAPEMNFDYPPTVSSATPAFLPNVAPVIEGSES